MNLTPLQRHDSAAYPGVFFTVRRLNYVQRCERDLALLDHRSRLAELLAQMEQLSDADTKKPRAGCELKHQRLDAEYSIIHQSLIVPAYIRAGFVSLEGADFDGATTVDAVIAGAPDDLLTEIFGACYAASDWSESQRKNLQSPGSSDAPEAGQTSSTTAPAAAA